MVERQWQSHDAHMTVPVILGRKVDPSTIKIIMRTKNEKYALRGESKIVAEEQTSFGGEKHLEGALLKQQNLPYKKQILKNLGGRLR